MFFIGHKNKQTKITPKHIIKILLLIETLPTKLLLAHSPKILSVLYRFCSVSQFTVHTPLFSAKKNFKNQEKKKKSSQLLLAPQHHHHLDLRTGSLTDLGLESHTVRKTSLTFGAKGKG